MTLTKVKLENFTAFANLKLEFSPGINVLIAPTAPAKPTC